MDSEIIVRRLYDYEIVMGTIDELWDTVGETGAEKYTPDLLKDIWLGLFLDGEYLGAYSFKSLTSVMYEGHVFMLKEKREHSMDCGYAIMNWLCENTHFNKVIVNIPECHKNVIDFVKRLGMIEQGYNSECFYKSGDLIGMYQYGISRGEMR